ncbi:MAG TPA: hypothetical protein VGC97_22790 [Pyrinomonadaceae bacterium]|jgi:hypothetical protein
MFRNILAVGAGFIGGAVGVALFEMRGAGEKKSLRRREVLRKETSFFIPLTGDFRNYAGCFIRLRPERRR